MIELFIPYEEALAIKELGFDEPCIMNYFNYTGAVNRITELMKSKYRIFEEDYFFRNSIDNTKNENPNAVSNYNCSAPTYSQALKWFRDTHSMYAIIDIDRTTYPKFVYNLYWYRDSEVTEIPNINFYYELYRKYEEAELEAIKELIKIVKNGR